MQDFKKIVLTASVLILVFLGFTHIAKMYKADIFLNQSVRQLKDGRKETSLEKVNKAIFANGKEPIYYRQRAKVYLSLLPDSNEESVEALKDLSLRDIKLALSLNNDNLVTIRECIPLYYFLSIDDFTKPGSPQNIDQNYIGISKDFFNGVKNRFVNDAGVLVSVAKYEKKLGFYDEFRLSQERIRILRPDLLNWYEGIN